MNDFDSCPHHKTACAVPLRNQRVRRRAKTLCNVARWATRWATDPDTPTSQQLYITEGPWKQVLREDISTLLSALIVSVNPRELDRPSRELRTALATAHELISVHYKIQLADDEAPTHTTELKHRYTELKHRYTELTSPETLRQVLTAIHATDSTP